VCGLDSLGHRQLRGRQGARCRGPVRVGSVLLLADWDAKLSRPRLTRIRRAPVVGQAVASRELALRQWRALGVKGDEAVLLVLESPGTVLAASGPARC
jgi:hypothetical protein